VLVDFPLDEAAAAGGRFEAEGGALIFGAALLEVAHGIEAGPGVRFGARAESEQGAFHVSEEGLPGQLAELGQCHRHQRLRNRCP
jgi:hypothetical protein